MPSSLEPISFDPVEELRVDTADGGILFDARRIPQADRNVLDAERWPELAKRGRGAVRRVAGEFGAGVLRTYRRGGMMARINREHYLWTGEDQTRPFREFRLLARMRALGLAVPAPLAAGYRRQGAFYRASILTTEIPDATTLAESMPSLIGNEAAWQSLGETLAGLHAAGIWHADLNAHNLLRDQQQRWWVIDFDRSRQRPADGVWPSTRLARLLRSLKKLGAAQFAGWSTAWQALLDAHDQHYARLTAESKPT